MSEIRAKLKRQLGSQRAMQFVQSHAGIALDQLEQRYVERREVVCVAGCRIEYNSFLFKGFDLKTCQSYLNRELLKENSDHTGMVVLR